MSRSVSAPSSVTKTSPCWNGLIVPGSTLIYGSSLRLVTRMPREARIAARDEAAMPFPSEETTPPVTNTNLVMGDKFRKFQVYMNRSSRTNDAPHTGLRMQSRVHSLPDGFAPYQCQDRVNRRRLERARDQRTHRHHDLRRFQPMLPAVRLYRGPDRFPAPV